MRFSLVLAALLLAPSLASAQGKKVVPMPDADGRYPGGYYAAKPPVPPPATSGVRRLPVQEIIPLLERDLSDTRVLLSFVEAIPKPDFQGKGIYSTSAVNQEELIAILEQQLKRLDELLTRCQKACQADPGVYLLIDRPMRWTQRPGPQKFKRSAGGITVYLHSAD